MPTSPRKLAPKTTAPTTAATASIVPASALRTGTAVRPVTGLEGHPHAEAARHRAGQAQRRGQPGEPHAPRRLVQPGRAGGPGGGPQRPGDQHQQRRQAMTTNPMPRIGTLTSIPGLGSANRAGPMGISGDAAMAIATATTAPAVVTRATLARDSTARPDRLMPRARRIGNSAESRMSWRFSSCPTTASAISAGQRGEDREGHRFRLNGPLGGRILGGQVDDLDGPHSVARGQGDGLAG